MFRPARANHPSITLHRGLIIAASTHDPKSRLPALCSLTMMLAIRLPLIFLSITTASQDRIPAETRRPPPEGTDALHGFETIGQPLKDREMIF
jgi:hypothetical protein